MARANLYKSMKNAMPGAFQAVEAVTPLSEGLEDAIHQADPERDPAPQSHPQSLSQGFAPMPPRRTLRARLFGRLADYARRYFTASVDHRLTLVQDRLDSMTAQGGRIEGQTQRLLSTVEWTTAQILDRMSAVEARCILLESQNIDLRASLDAVQARNIEQFGILKRHTDHQEQLSERLNGSIDTFQAQMIERFGAMAGRSESLQLLTQGLFALANAAQAQMLERFSGLDVQTKDLELLARGAIKNTEDTQIIIGRVGTTISEVGENLRGLPGLMGPRFDELEIKIRPLVTFDEDSYAIRLRDGYAMVPRSEPIFAVMVANATSEGLEPGTRRVLQALIEPGMGVADVGANVGLLTLACAVATGPTGRVYAFEPEAGPRSQLQKTRHLNGLSWVDVHDLAVGAESGAQTFHVSPIIGHSSLYALPTEDGAGKDIEVQVRRLDDVIESGKRLDVVKIDVEGAELDVLSGMKRLLSDNPDIAIVAEFGPSHLARIGIKPKDWFQAFKDAGFDAYAISEPRGVCSKVSHKDLKDVVSINIAFVRPQGAARLRLPQ